MDKSDPATENYFVEYHEHLRRSPGRMYVLYGDSVGHDLYAEAFAGIYKAPPVQIDHGLSVGTLALQEANAEIGRLTRLLVESSETIAHLTAVIAGNPPTDGRSKVEQISDALKFDRPLSSYGRSD